MFLTNPPIVSRSRATRTAAMLAMVGMCSLAATARTALADAFGQSYNNSATISLTAAGDGVIVFSGSPSFRRAHATAYADHSDTPGSTFNENMGPNSATAASSEPNLARVLNANADLSNLVLGVDDAYSFAHSGPPSNAFADGLAELEVIFQIASASGEQALTLHVNVSGTASLQGNSPINENWTANYQFYIEIYDFAAPNTPVVLSGSLSNGLSGPGPQSLTDSLSLAGRAGSLLVGHDYGLYAYFDAESSAVAPAPGTLALGVVGLSLVARRRRR